MSKTEQRDPPPPYTPFTGESQPTGYQQFQGESQHGPQVVTQPPGYQPYAGPTQYPLGAAGNVPSYGAMHTTMTIPQTIIIVNACPACRIGVLEDQYNALGILCAILFFPLGILCCLMTRTKKCSNCGAYFD